MADRILAVITGLVVCVVITTVVCTSQRSRETGWRSTEPLRTPMASMSRFPMLRRRSKTPAVRR
jgi:hypothetical protein